MSVPSYITEAADATASDASLGVIRDKLRRVRDLRLQISDLQSQISNSTAELTTLERQTLPDLFQQSGINQLGLEPEGNMPGYNAKLVPYFKANIAESWEPERKAAAFAYLREKGAEDLIKSTITIRLPLRSSNLRTQVLKLLHTIKGLEYTESLAVPWNTLTAWLKETITKRHEMPQLDVLGADVGQVIKLQEQEHGQNVYRESSRE